MTIHHDRMLATVLPPVRALPPHLFHEQRKKCEGCGHLIRESRKSGGGIRCAAVLHLKDAQTGKPMYCIDVIERNRCPA